MLDSYTHFMNYFAAHPELGIDMRFGTLSDYFTLVRQRVPAHDMQTTVGDFMPYCDKASNYWTGYYTTRPAFK